ncbi:hypothetical protein [Cupriavidus necator]|uniref:hypothetical protein n=1 Tax=Cupriavidus necator TaxID=106590 RepID=UPI000B1C4437|nr:hypothetical protein [Cupriavidus necator]
MKTVGTREAVSSGQAAYAKPIGLTAYLDAAAALHPRCPGIWKVSGDFGLRNSQKSRRARRHDVLATI